MTTGLTVVDRGGNIASWIQSVYSNFGSGITVEGLGFTLQNRGAGFTLDPSHPNVLAGGKRPGFLGGDDWFFSLGLTSDTVIAPRTFPIPVGVQTTARPGSLDTFGRSGSLVLAQTFIASASLLKGSTAFKPPEIEYKVSLAFNVNHVRVPERRVLVVEPAEGNHRTDGFLGLQGVLVDRPLS